MEILVPITFFIGFFGGGVALSLYLRYRARLKAIDAITHALELNAQLSPAQIEAIATQPQPSRVDLRRGVFLIGIALAALVLGLLHDGAARNNIIGLSAFPGAIGAAYLLLFLLNRSQHSVDAS